ncbi:PREDICTED: pentatricopeptide repeat-containing protein At1g62260, mitochondrial-like [Tarenaya hassleriana]|uniref:pentatricopeptide repeat-containing protein At1g62260, mitochondrial-like n=1 Tax=Tarenaya hassleriana TaxID=28532 RepID=UPI00053C1067|nr:PREDICTED: pentatricopeptide repeat-containing protein At1g62260, mitochondrial-like [Tarenaya hassleriana]
MRILDTSLTILRRHLSRRIFTISTANLNRLINSYLTDDRLVEARSLFDQNTRSLDNATWNTMINAYVRRRRIREAHELFDQMPQRDVASWNALLMGLTETRDPERVVWFFLEMQRSGLNPDEHTISVLVNTVSGSSFKILIEQIHALAICSGLNLSAYAGSALLKGYSSIKNPTALQRIFDDILLKDVSSWNSLIMGYMKLGFVGKGEKAFNQMPDRNIVSFHTMIIGYIRNTMIDKARILFDQMCERNVFSWTVMINGYVRRRKFIVALKLFKSMVESGYRPSHYTLSTVLDACSGCSLLPMGKQVHSIITKFGMECDIVLSTSLLDMYAKSGDISAASFVFSSMKVKNSASWNSMIGGFARHGQGTNALEEFGKMLESGFKPDQVTFINLLMACAHAGLVEEGEEQFSAMSKYGIAAEKEHYACMVDLYGRAGQLDKAERLIKGMPFEPDVVIWGALLGACGLHSCLELGEVAANGVSKLRSDHPAAYEVLLRIHGEKGVWTSVTELRKLMKQKNAKKQKAGSWVESPLDDR